MRRPVQAHRVDEGGADRRADAGRALQQSGAETDRRRNPARERRRQDELRPDQPQRDVEEHDDRQRQREDALRQRGDEHGAEQDADRAAEHERRQEIGGPQIGAEAPDLPEIGDEDRKADQRHGMLHAEEAREDRQRHDRQAHAGRALDESAEAEGERHHKEGIEATRPRCSPGSERCAFRAASRPSAA